MLHSGKRESIVAWFNAMTMMKKDIQVSSILQFSDGKKFLVLISIVNNLRKGILPEDFQNSESKDPDTDCPKEKDTESVSDNKNEAVFVAEIDDEKTTEMEIETSIETNESQNTLNPDTSVENKDNTDEMEILKIFEDIKKFIDDFLAHDSSSIIFYSECPKGNELELAKVAVLLLSAVVQSYLSINMQHLYYTTVLDAQAQEDIKECLSLILVETDEPLKKVELQKILGRPSKSKSTPRRRTPSRNTSEVLETPENSKSLSKRKQAKTNMAEEVFESPLKTFWDSPRIQLKTSLFKKDVEINKLRDALHIEECKVIDLTIEKRSLNAELEKKKRELEFLKEDRRKALESADEVDAVKSIKLEEHLAEKQKDNKIIHELKEELDILKKENEKICSELAELEKLSEKNHVEEAKFKEETNELIRKIDSLELNIKFKDGKIKDLKQSELSLKNDLKSYRQMLDETNKKAVTPRSSPRSYETVNIIYADARDVMKEREDLLRKLSIETENAKTLKKSCEDAKAAELKYKIELEKKEQELQSEKHLVAIYEKWSNSVQKPVSFVSEEMASNNVIETLQSDKIKSRSSPIESERDTNVKEESGISAILCDRAMETRSRSTSLVGSRRNSAPVATLSLNEMNLFKDRIISVTTKLTEKFDKSEYHFLDKLASQAKSCNSIQDVCQYFSTLNSFIDSFKSPQPIPSKRGRPPASREHDATIHENMKRKMDEIQKECKRSLDLKTNELKLSEEKYKALDLQVQELNLKLEKSLQDVEDATSKLKMANQNHQKAVSEQRQLLKVVKALKDEDKKSNEPCKDCQMLRKKLLNMKHDKNEYEKDSLELRALVKEMESRAKNLERQLKVEIKEKKRLEFKIQRESAFLSGNISDKRAVVHKYFQQGAAESRKAKERKLESTQPPPVISLNAYILTNESKEPCPENSMSSTFANRSIRSGFLQTDDEEDFLNHSSLAQIQRETRPEIEESSDKRLTEIRRRNTLCLPHLQSSYPLELQNMTPTERKYYYEFRRPQPVADDLESELVSDESNDVPSYPVNKRKAAEVEDISTQPIKKQARVFQIKHVSKEKSTTPIKKIGMLYKNKTFKTPTSIRRLMGMSRKNN